MKKRTIIAILLFLSLSTISYKHEIIIDKFNIKTIIIENNFLINEIELKKLLSPVYNKSLFNLKNSDYVYENILSLPYNNFMSKSDVVYVCKHIKKFISQNQK